MALRPCPRCVRHVRVGDRCPFCAAASVAVAALGASIAIAACGGDVGSRSDAAADGATEVNDAATDAGFDGSFVQPDAFIPQDALSDQGPVPVYGAPGPRGNFPKQRE